MERNRKDFLLGILIIIVGILFLGNNLEVWDLNIFFNGWWTFFIIIPSIYSLFFSSNRMSSLLGILIGVLLLLASQNIIEWNMIVKIFIPALIIYLGFKIIIHPYVKKVTHKNRKGIPQYIGVFSGCEERIRDDFLGGNCVAVLGGVDLDLRDAKIKEDIVIECVTVMGGIDIKVPDNVIVKTNGISIFGGTTNKNSVNNEEKIPIIYINYVCIFGGIDIK